MGTPFPSVLVVKEKLSAGKGVQMNQTECRNEGYRFQAVGKREVVGQFNAGHVSSDAGAVLLAEVEKKREIIKRLGECFIDYRDQRYCEHSVEELLKQRIYGIALGYEDLIDHDDLRVEPLLAVTIGKKEPEGVDRRRQQDKGKPMAGKSTLNRTEGAGYGNYMRWRRKEVGPHVEW